MSFFEISPFYLINTFLLFFTAVIQCYTRSRLFFFMIALVVIGYMIFVSAARTSGGTDLSEYLSLWETLIPFSTDTYTGNYSYFEPGFRLFLSTLKGIYDNPSFYLFSIALFIHLILIISIIRVSGNALIALLVFYLSFFVSYTLNGAGQAVTMVIFILILPLLYQGRAFLYSSVIFATMLFHKSIILIFPAILFNKFLKKTTTYFLILILAIFLNQLGAINFLGSLVGIPIQSLPQIYTDSSIGIFDILQKAILLIFAYICVAKVTKSEFDWFVLKLYLAAPPLYFVFMDLPIFATRMYIFFRILEVVILSRTFEEIRNSNNKLIYLFIIMILYLPGFYVQITHPDSILAF